MSASTTQREPVAHTELLCPPGLDYMPYQQEGIREGCNKFRVLIADEQGLGKTIQAIGIMNQHPRYKRILVICPASLCQNWEAEIKKWSVVPRSIGIAREQKWEDTDIVIIPLTSVWRDSYPWLLRSVAWDLMIVDEAHNLRNAKGRQGMVVYGKAKVFGLWARQVLALTGTPIPNRPADAWALFAFLWPEMFGNWYAFMRRYCSAKKLGGHWDTKGSSNERELNALLLKCGMIRRLKRDVLKDLPAKIRKIIPLEPTEEVKRVMNRELMIMEVHKDTIESLRVRRELAAAFADDKEFREAGKALRASLNEAFTEMARARVEMGLLKVPWVVEQALAMLEDGHKLVIMCVHTDVIDGIMDGLAKAGIKSVKYNGDTPMMKRHAIVTDFQDPKSEVRVFVGNIQAAGTGITLTASELMLFAEEDWVPGRINQAEDRIHRIGQKGNVMVVHMVFNGSLDTYMMQTWIEKQDVIDSILDPEEEMAGDDTPDEIPGLEPYERKEQTIWNKIGDQMTILQRHAAAEGIKFMSSLDKDQATARNGVGYSKMDTEIGSRLMKDLMRRGSLTPAQSALAAKVLRKYRRQLPQSVSDALADVQLS